MKKLVLMMITIINVVCFAGLPASAEDSPLRLWNVYFDVFKDAKYIDLTHAFEPVQSVWPGFGNAKFKPAKAGKRIEGYVEVGQEFTYEKDTDTTPTLEGEYWLMHNHFAQAEGVANLDKVPEAGALIIIGFAKPKGGTGGYARYIAVTPKKWMHGVSVTEAPGAPLPVQAHPLSRDKNGVMRPRQLATNNLPS